MDTEIVKKSFVLYTDNQDIFEALSDEEAGQLIKAFFVYAASGEVPEMDRALALLFLSFKGQFDRNNEKYSSVVTRNKANGKKGGRPKKALGKNETQKTQSDKLKPKKADTDSDNDSDTDNDTLRAYALSASLKFLTPTLEEIKAYCKERNNTVDPQKFFDYFTASDWVDSKGNKVRSWKQKVITWEARETEQGRGGLKKEDNTSPRDYGGTDF